MGVREQNHQKYERKNTIQTQFYELKTQNSIFWKFLGNYMLGNFLETICWEIFRIHMMVTSADGNTLMENSCGYQRLFDESNNGTMLWHHTTVSRQRCQKLS